MQNVVATVKGNMLTLTIDLTKNFGPSKSGKTVTVATSNGFQKVPTTDDISFSLNVNKKAPQ